MKKYVSLLITQAQILFYIFNVEEREFFGTILF